MDVMDPVAAHQRLAAQLSSTRLTGFDPMAGLLSPLAARLPRGLPEQLWLRAVSMSGRAGLAAARVPQLRMVKTLALVALAQQVFPCPEFDNASIAAEIQNRRNSDGGWGYEFDAQFRWGRYSAAASNAIVTAFVVEGLDSSVQRADRPLRRYVFRDLLDPGGFFRYYAGSPVLIHNANALLCRAVARLGEADDVATTALNHTVRERNTSGLWEYGDRADLRWVDIYHNAYIGWVLQDLAVLGMVDGGLLDESSDAWLEHFFDPSGAPKLHDTDRGPTRNVNATATALFWLCTMREPPRPVEPLIHSTAAHLLALQRPDGSVGDGAVRYPRWNDAPALLALAAYRRWTGGRAESADAERR